MKIAIIGTSHVAAIKRAADQAGSNGAELTFFGSTGRTISTLAYANGALVSDSPIVRESYTMTAGVDRIELARFDAFALVGLLYEYRANLTLYRGHVRYEHQAFMPGTQLISEAAAAAALRDSMMSFPGSWMGKLISKDTGRPVIIVPSPCPAARILKDGTFSRFRRAIDTEYPSLLYEDYVSTAKSYAEKEGFRWLPHNRATFEYPGFNREEYSMDSGEIGWTLDTRGPKKRGDDWHMNANYGKVVLDDLLAAAKAAT